MCDVMCVVGWVLLRGCIRRRMRRKASPKRKCEEDVEPTAIVFIAQPTIRADQSRSEQIKREYPRGGVTLLLLSLVRFSSIRSFALLCFCIFCGDIFYWIVRTMTSESPRDPTHPVTDKTGGRGGV